MCELEVDDYCAVWSEFPRMARKEHECDACGAVIPRRSAYLVHFNVYEGYPSREKSCFACWAAREEFADAHKQSCTPSSLVERLEECIEYGDEDDAKRWQPILESVLARCRAVTAAKLRGVT